MNYHWKDIPLKSFFPTTPSTSQRQGTWLTRLGPRPQIEGTLHWVPVQQVERSCTGLMLWVPIKWIRCELVLVNLLLAWAKPSWSNQATPRLAYLQSQRVQRGRWRWFAKRIERSQNEATLQKFLMQILSDKMSPNLQRPQGAKMSF